MSWQLFRENVKDLRFATPEEVIQVMGCEVGACYPLGIVANLKTYADSCFNNDEVARLLKSCWA